MRGRRRVPGKKRKNIEEGRWVRGGIMSVSRTFTKWLLQDADVCKLAGRVLILCILAQCSAAQKCAACQAPVVFRLILLVWRPEPIVATLDICLSLKSLAVGTVIRDSLARTELLGML